MSIAFPSTSLPLPCTSDSSGTDSSSNLSPSAMGLILNQTVDAKPKSTKKKKFKELYKVDVDTIGHGGVHRMILRRKTVLPVPQSRKTTTKQEKPAALSSASVATQENEGAKNEKVEIGGLVRKGPASLPKKSPETKNVLKPKPAHNSLFPPVEVPSTAAGRRKLLSQLTKERDNQMAKLLDLCALEMNNPQQ